MERIDAPCVLDGPINGDLFRACVEPAPRRIASARSPTSMASGPAPASTSARIAAGSGGVDLGHHLGRCEAGQQCA
ncbi:hypothetical protein VB636_00640, partial [Paracoccus sp. APAP_BH8]|uniref:hypothetical protein n=1 Tax=Paracoccus sp. APAP_BH8 TaxID=3110237 RepID=UPI002FD83782